MKTKYFILSISSVLVLMLLTGCYTSLGTVRHHSVYEEDVEYVEEEDSGTVDVYHHYYSRPYYRHRFTYYDPYDYWYDEPGFYISIGYVHRPYYYSGYYGCVYPAWHPVVYRPYYVPVWYYDPGHPKPYYAYKKRDFKKRRNIDRGRYARNNKGRNNRDGIYNSGGKTIRNDDSGNSGRRTINRRSGTGIDRKDKPVIARRTSTVSKRGSTRLPDRSIKTRSIEKKRNYSGNRTRKAKDTQYKRKTSKNNTTKQVNRRIQTKSDNSKRNYQKSRPNKSKNTSSKSRSSSVRKSRSYKSEKSTSSRNSSYSRPKTRENKKTTYSKPAKRSKSTRSSYSPPKSKAKSSSSNNRKRSRR